MPYLVKRFFIATAILLSIISCGSQDRLDSGDYISGSSDTTTPMPTESTQTGSFSIEEKSFLYNLFLTDYFWAEYTPQNFDTSPYNDPQSMINDLKYSPLDRWSVVITNEQFNAFSEQSSFGFGFYPIYDINGNLLVSNIEINSPADKAGIKRGDIIQTINGEVATEELFYSIQDERGKIGVFGINRSGQSLTIAVAVQYYSYKVSSGSIVNSIGGESVGYLRFDSFTDNATNELEPIFTLFKQAEITKLVIDMRYNGGGLINTASILLDKLVRDKDEQIQFSTIWNSSYSYKNEIYRFETDINSLDLKQVVFLVTEDSASASELVINSLSTSYLGIDVILVGSTTHGKPVGMSGALFGNNIYYLINFALANGDGFYNYFNGLPVNCPVADDFTHEQGDVNEAMLKKALYYIDNGSC
jgi:C-terminal processing protease CtpA/Prc